MEIRRARTRLALAGVAGWLLLAGLSAALHHRSPGPTAQGEPEAVVHTRAYSAGTSSARPTRSATPAP
jgi:hypothetical protein|nr:hypothetical protein [Phenylobacterium sp.]